MSGAVEGVALLPEWVGQKHKCGCMAAVLAMILGVDYDAAARMLTDTPESLHNSASGYFVLESRLVDNGYAVARKWAVTQPGNKRRDQWPVEPWADVHWCEVMAGATNGYAHAVLMLRNGSVLDPMTPEPRRLSDYEAVNFIAAVIPVITTPPARSYADGEGSDTIAFVQDWLANADYDPTQFDKGFAAAIDERVSAGVEAAAKVAESRWEVWAGAAYKDTPQGDRAACADVAAAIRLLSQGGKANG